MPVSTLDPFYNADQARSAASRVNRSANDIGYLRAYFSEKNLGLSDCEIVTITYLAWYGTMFESGISFEEHAAKLGLPNCKLDQAWKDEIEARKSQEKSQRIAFALEEAEQEKENTFLLGGVGLGLLVTVGAWFVYRRRIKSSPMKQSEPK